MIARSIATVLAALLAFAASPAAAAVSEAALDRAVFRTLTIKYTSAPRETIAAASSCAAKAARAFPAKSQEKIVEIDKRPVYSYNDRLSEIVEVLYTLDAKATQPFADCFDGIGSGRFGPIQGASEPATSAPKPANVAACPISVERFGENELSCHCSALLGGIAYGHKTYSDLSSVCLAARHAGVFDYLTGGVIKAVFKPGCAAYEGVMANGYPSASGGRSPRSFHFPSVGAGKCPN